MLENKLQISAQALVGRMVAVLGITGSGKTNTAAVLVEEFLATGYPMTIVDIEGEYYGLKERFEILVAGRSENVDIEAGPKEAPALAELSVKKGIAIVLDVSEFDEVERFEFLLAYFNALWEANFKDRKPYAIFLEEAHEFIPQSVRTPLKAILTRLALRGRKRGFGVVLMSQRSAKVDKDVLTQASVSFLHKVIHPTDLSVYKDLIPLPAKEVESMVGALGTGQAIVLYDNKVQSVSIRLRHTLHVGATPEIGETLQLSNQRKLMLRSWPSFKSWQLKLKRKLLKPLPVKKMGSWPPG
jgi:DNA helicase HerA-like ATPase